MNNTPKPPDPLAQRRRTYKGITSGVVFICIGTVLLLNTSGYLGWGVWASLLRFWPVLLISIGLRLLFMNTPLHPLCLIGPALIIATTIWVSMQYREGQEWSWSKVSYAESMPIDCPSGSGTGPIDLRLMFAAGGLNFISEASEAAPAVTPAAVSATAPPITSGVKGTIRYVGDEPHVSCASNGDLRIERFGNHDDGVHVIIPFVYGDTHWEARMSAQRPVDARLEVAAANADIDLSDFTLTHLSMDSAASNVTLRLGKPTGRVPVKINGAVSHLRIRTPEGTCVAVTRERVLNFLEMEGTPEAGRRPHLITSRGCEGVAADGPRYDIRYEMPVSTVSVQSD